MGEHKETGKVKLLSLTAPVVAPCCQILHKHHGEEEMNSEVDNSTALWMFGGISSQAEWNIKDINMSLNLTRCWHHDGSDLEFMVNEKIDRVERTEEGF